MVDDDWRGDEEEARDYLAGQYPDWDHDTVHGEARYLAAFIRRARAAARREALEEATAECRKEERHQETIIQRSDRKPLRATPGLSESAAAARIRMAIRALIDDSEGT